MPYIVKEAREYLEKEATEISNPGELNYVIARLVDEYIGHHGLSYSVVNEVVGVLECTKMEIYRRVIIPYEDKKLQENGEVYLKCVTI